MVFQKGNKLGRKFEKGHPRLGGRLFESGNPYQFKKGEDHPLWLGDMVQNHGLHAWVKNNLPKPPLCQRCKSRPPYDLANVTGVYNRDFKNWEYLCRSCHWKLDGMVKNLYGRRN